MKKVIFFLLTVFTVAGWTAAQGTYEASLPSAKSIVRVWHGDEMVIYNHDSGGKGQFILWSNGATVGQLFDLPYVNAEVLDFEILEDTVMFCGVYSNPAFPGAGTCGFVGRFEISSAFAGAGPVEFTALINWINLPYGAPTEAIFIRNLKRIDVFKNDTVGAVAALIGDSYVYTDRMYERVSVLSAYRMSPIHWQVYSTVPKDGRKVFTDIAVLDDMVVAAGHGISNTHCITRAYHKTYAFPSNPFVNFWFDSIYTAGYTPVDDVLAAHVEGNVMALAQFNTRPRTILHVLEFNTVTGHPTQFTSSRVTDIHGCNTVTCPWRLDGLRYSPTNNTLHILERGMLPGDVTMNSLLWTFPLMYGGEPTAYVQKVKGLTQTSLDVDIDDHPVTSGIVDATGQLDIHTFAPGGAFIPLPSSPTVPVFDIYDNCTYNTEDIISTPTVTIGLEGVDRISIDHTPENRMFVPNVHEIIFDNICK